MEEKNNKLRHSGDQGSKDLSGLMEADGAVFSKAVERDLKLEPLQQGAVTLTVPEAVERDFVLEPLQKTDGAKIDLYEEIESEAICNTMSDNENPMIQSENRKR